MLGHGGASHGFRSEFWFSTESKETIIYFVNEFRLQKSFSEFRENLNGILKNYR